MTGKAKICWYRYLILLLTALYLWEAAPVCSYEMVETPEGLVLVREVKTRTGGQDLEALDEGLRDPFTWAPAIVESQQRNQRPVLNPVFEQLVLTGILWDETFPLAIIDGTVLREGDLINGAVVRSIYQDEVLLELDNDFYNLRFSELFELEKLQIPGEQIGPSQ